MEKDIKKFIDTDIVKKIFANVNNIKEYLYLSGFEKKDISKLNTQELYEKVVRQRDYNKSLKTIRELFKKTDKYKQGKDSSESIDILLKEWKDLGLGENWKNEAINNPLKVAEYLYKYQDEGRFGYSPRLYIDEEIKPIDIQKRINEINLNNPLEITFTYKHKDLGNKTYKTQAFVILFYKS